MDEDDVRTLNTHIAQTKSVIPRSTMKNMMCIVVTSFCEQSKAFTLDLGDDQSRYLYDIQEDCCAALLSDNSCTHSFQKKGKGVENGADNPDLFQLFFTRWISQSLLGIYYKNVKTLGH